MKTLEIVDMTGSYLEVLSHGVIDLCFKRSFWLLQ